MCLPVCNWARTFMLPKTFGVDKICIMGEAQVTLGKLGC